MREEPNGDAYTLLLAAIEKGDLPAGTRLRETELAKHYQTSRTPIREALKRLQAEGLVTHEPHRGAVVATLGYAQMVELYELREVLEGTSASLAAVHASRAELDHLMEFVSRDRRLLDAPGDLAQANLIFHRHLVLSARNEYLSSVLGTLSLSLALLPGTTLGAPDRAAQSLDEHQAIVERVAAHDPDGAEAAARSHIRNALRIRLKQLLPDRGLPDDYLPGSQASTLPSHNPPDREPSGASRPWRLDGQSGPSTAADRGPSQLLLAEQAYQRLHEAIAVKDLPPGRRLAERELSKFLNISRTPVREALRRLESEGLVRAVQPRGFVITELDHRDASDLYTMREVLEAFCAELAAASATDVEVDLMQDLVAREGKLLDDVRAMTQINRQIHQLIYRAAHNRYAFRILNQLRDANILLGPTTLEVPGRPERAHTEHSAIVEAIAARDAATAGAAARHHVRCAFKSRLTMTIDREILDAGETTDSPARPRHEAGWILRR